MPRALTLLVLGGVALIGTGPRQAASGAPTEVILRGGLVIDGTGAPGHRADVAIRGDRIVAVGEPLDSDHARVIDVTGLVVAPGFIDLHSHSDRSILNPQTRANRNYLMQGVTTVVTGNCGYGPTDVGAFLRKVDSPGAGTNVIALIPQGSVRAAVLGTASRRPNPAELARMEAIVARAMKDGAWGLSAGLIYVPGCFAETDELIALARVVARRGGIYATHLRDEQGGLLDSIDEALRIGREAGLPVHLSHLKANLRPNWGLVVPACERIAEARRAGQAVTADQYPYTASSTQLAAMVVPPWALRGTAAEFARIALDPERGPRLRREIEAELDRRDEGASIRIASYPLAPSRVGRDLVAIARREGVRPVDIVVDILAHGGAQAIQFGMDEDDVRHVMRQPYVATASDASAHAPGTGDRPHPRAYGTFPRKIRYALDEHVLTLEQAIHSATGLPASILGLPERGTIRAGNYADLVVFDPGTFRDRATFDNPVQLAEGVRFLFVNGVAVVTEGAFQGTLAGRALRLTDDGPADLILKVSRAWTGDPEHPWAEAVASRRGEIVAVGTADDLARFRGPRTRLLDRPHDFALPGLIDAHTHLIHLGAAAEELDLRGVARLDEVARRVRERLKATPAETWITGQNWDQSLWPGGAFPTAAVLDAVAPDRPVWLTRVDGHAGWANSEAMRRAGVDATARDPAGGQILRDRDGRPTGVFLDAAMRLVSRAVPPVGPERIRRRILAAQAQALTAGLTGAHEAGLSRDEIEAYRRLDRDGALKLRVYGMARPSGTDGGELLDRPPARPRPTDRFELRAMKVFIDGAMGSRGGLLFDPYSDDPGNRGLLLTEPETLTRITTRALRSGWQVCTHAIGDRGNALVLDAYEAARAAVPQAKDPRLRIEHAQVVRRPDVHRFAALKVIASMQPSHAIDDMRWADARLGPGRSAGAYAWRWFLDAGVPLAFGSDVPVEVINPFLGIYAAVTREDEQGRPPGGWHPDQRLTLEEALRGFTAGSAFAGFAEDRVGVLRPGHRADLTVIDRDLFRVAPREVLGAKVTLTIIDGEVVFEKKPPR